MTDPRGRTALHLACGVKPGDAASGEPDGRRSAAALLKAGADLEAEMPVDEHEGDFRATPLWFAVARGEHLPLTQFLLECGADPSYSLWAVVWRDDENFCRALLSRKPRLNLKAEGETPIFYAARLKRLKTLSLLIEAGADQERIFSTAWPRRNGSSRSCAPDPTCEIVRTRRAPFGHRLHAFLRETD